jgi:hypothetical protein
MRQSKLEASESVHLRIVQVAEVLRKLNDREREMWCRRFPQSCLERMENSEAVDEQTREFSRDVQRKLKEQRSEVTTGIGKGNWKSEGGLHSA